MTRGKFIVFEGLDRSGKSTQSRLLTEKLQQNGELVKHRCFPDRTTVVGQMIDSYLQSKSNLSNEAIHLLFSANRWEVASLLEQDLRDGFTVVCDRYAFSGVAYTAAKGLDFQWCKNPDVGLPAPDAVFFLKADPQSVKARAEYGEERYEKIEFQEKVKSQFDKFSTDEFWHSIDASRDIETIHEELMSKFRKIATGEDIPRLWTKGETTPAAA